MDYGIIIIASVVFFASLSFMAIAFSKKPTKKHIMEIEEAGLEIAKQIQEATEDSLNRIENKIKELEKRYEYYEAKIEEKMIEENKEVIKQEEQVVRAKEINEKVEYPKIDIKDEKAKDVFKLYQKGLSVNQIAKEMGMYAGVVQVYINLFKMNNEKIAK